jgi:hypothetical protein
MYVWKGTATTIQGSYELDGQSHRFDLVWDRNTWQDGTWQSPSDTPAIGSEVRLRYDPANPERVTTARESSGHPTTLYTITGVLLLLAMAGLYVWAALRAE